MSEVINPPDYYFTGINFNPAFYAEDTTGLSQTLANTLYLRKTVPDTATAQETFSSGIITPTINSTSNGFLNVVVPMVDSGSGLNVAVAPRTIAGQVHHYSDGDNCVAGAGVHLNNGINNNSATNIHNGIGANPSGIVNIMTGTSNSGTVNIGATGTTTNVKGNSVIGVAGSGTVTINRPLTIGYTALPTFPTNSIGSFYKYDYPLAAALAPGSNHTVVNFTNTPAGLYLLTIGTSTIVSFDAADRFDLIYLTSTNIGYMSSSNQMEYGGNAKGAIGLSVTFPLKILDNTSQLTMQIANNAGSGGNIVVNSGSSILMRLA